MKKKRMTKNIWCWFFLLLIIFLSLFKIYAQKHISLTVTPKKQTYNKEKKETKKTKRTLYEENGDFLTEREILEMQRIKREDRHNIKSSILTPEDEQNIFRLGKIIAAEGGGVDSQTCQAQAIQAGITSDIWQQYIGYVVLNRVYQNGYPDTIESVFYQEGQYADTSIEKYEQNFFTDNSLKNAEIAYLNYLYNNMPVPKNMVFQSEFIQGDVILHVGNTYFGAAPSLPAE